MLAEGRRRQLHVLLTVVLDACTIAAAFSLAYLLRFFWEVVPASDSPPVGPYLAILPVLVPVWIGVFAAYGLYRERLQGFFDEGLRVACGCAPRDHCAPGGRERDDPPSFCRVPGGGGAVRDRSRPVHACLQRRRG